MYSNTDFFDTELLRVLPYDILPSNTNTIYLNTAFHKRSLFVRIPDGMQTYVSGRCIMRASQKYWLTSIARAPQ